MRNIKEEAEGRRMEGVGKGRRGQRRRREQKVERD